MKFIKKITGFIPGFRQLSSNSMIIAATYYGAAILTLFKYWYWGVALLAAPFFVFYLIDLNRMKNRRLSLIAAIVAGVLVLLGTAAALSTGGLQEAPAVASMPVTSMPATSSAAATAPARTGVMPLKTKSAAASPLASGFFSPAASPGTDQAQYAYVSAKGSKTFHRPECPSAKRIKPENLVGFKTREEAISAGLQPCKRCKP